MMKLELPFYTDGYECLKSTILNGKNQKVESLNLILPQKVFTHIDRQKYGANSNISARYDWQLLNRAYVLDFLKINSREWLCQLVPSIKSLKNNKTNEFSTLFHDLVETIYFYDYNLNFSDQKRSFFALNLKNRIFFSFIMLMYDIHLKKVMEFVDVKKSLLITLNLIV